jgi:hypothetical protein
VGLCVRFRGEEGIGDEDPSGPLDWTLENVFKAAREGESIMPLSDIQQAELTLASGILISVGAVSIPAGLPWYYGLVIALCGAVGLGIKEALGAKPSPNPNPPSQ